MKTFFYECFYDVLSKRFAVTNALIAFFVITSLAIIPVELLSGDPEIVLRLDNYAKVAATFFIIEYILRLYSAQNPLQHACSIKGLVHLVAFLPFLFYHVGFLGHTAWMFLRLLRLLKLLYVDEIHEENMRRVNTSKRYGALIFDPHEEILLIVRHSPLIFLLEVIFATMLLGISLAFIDFMEWTPLAWSLGGVMLFFTLLVFMRAWLNHHYDALYITNIRLIFQDKGLIGTLYNEFYYRTITNLIPDTRGILNLLLRMGTLSVEKTGKHNIVKFHHVHHPERIAELINQHRA